MAASQALFKRNEPSRCNMSPDFPDLGVLELHLTTPDSLRRRSPELLELGVGFLQQLVQLLLAVILVLLKGFSWQAAQLLDFLLQLCPLALQGAALTHQRLKCLLLILYHDMG